MANKAYQKIYTQLESITKATVSLKAKGVTNDELAIVDGRLAQVVRTKKDTITMQVFSGTEGIPTNAEVAFLGAPPTLNVSEQLSGRFFNAYGKPIDGGPEVEGEERLCYLNKEGLLESIPLLDEEVEYLAQIQGSVPHPLKLPKGCRFSTRCEYATDKCRNEKPELVEVEEGHLIRCFYPKSGGRHE